jgi:multiple sugar transport system substrate-binding protein
MPALLIGANHSDAAESFNWRQFEGHKIVACFSSHVHYDAVAKLIPEFTEQTGIKVEIDRLNYLLGGGAWGKTKIAL